MAAFRSVFGCLLLVSAVACGGRSVDMLPYTDEGGSGPSAGSGGQAHGGSGHAGTAQGGSSSAGTAQGGITYGGSSFGGTGQGGGFGGTAYGGTGTGGSAGQCSAYLDQSSWYVPVQIINKASKTIYVGQETVGCDVNAAPPFQVQNATGALLRPPSMCATPCWALVAGMGIGGCPAICWYPSALTLKPGEVFETTYNGLFGQQASIPPECTNGLPYNQCQQTLHVQPGSYTFSALAGLDLDCSQTSGEPCNVCTPNSNGGCTTPSAVISGQRLTATTRVNLDSSYGVWADASAAAEPSPGGNSGAAPAPRAVQIVFAD